MASYTRVKQASIELIDLYSHNHDINDNYGKPPKKPVYDASTGLASIGLNVYVRRAMTKGVNNRMRQVCGKTWQNAGPFDMADVTTIGEFIELMSELGSVVVPSGEPS